MKSRANILRNFNAPLSLEELEIPRLEEGQILVRILASGVCGSDLHMWRGQDPRLRLPMIPGHEGTGEVVEVNGVRSTVDGEPIRPGDLVFWNRGVSCGKCYYCTVAKEPALCPDRWTYGIHKSLGDPPYLAGCYSEYIVLTKDTDVFKVPGERLAGPGGPGTMDVVEDQDYAASLSPQRQALCALVSASCSGATAAHAIESAGIQPGDVVLVQGPGPLGVYCVAFAREKGAAEIVLIGGSEERLRAGEKFGATVTLNRRTTREEERREAILDLTHGRGVDVGIEASGTLDAFKEGIRLIRPGGRYVTPGFGVPAGSLDFDPFWELTRKNITLAGVWVSDTRHVYQAFWLALRRLNLFASLVSHILPLERAEEGLLAVEGRRATKAVLAP